MLVRHATISCGVPTAGEAPTAVVHTKRLSHFLMLCASVRAISFLARHRYFRTVATAAQQQSGSKLLEPKSNAFHHSRIKIWVANTTSHTVVPLAPQSCQSSQPTCLLTSLHQRPATLQQGTTSTASTSLSACLCFVHCTVPQLHSATYGMRNYCHCQCHSCQPFALRSVPASRLCLCANQ